MQTPTPRAIEDARQMIANPDRYQDLPVDKQERLRRFCWLILETGKGTPARQIRRIVVKPMNGGKPQ
jgi:hypothetical protein